MYEGKGIGHHSEGGTFLEGSPLPTLGPSALAASPLKGRPIFVPYVLPGEVVQVAIVKRHRQFFEADLIEVLKPSPNRVQAPCRYFGECGGCQWQHIDYETQLEWKQKILAETLERIGKVTEPKVLPTLPAPKQWGWRSRVTIHQDEKGQIGFFAPGTHQVVDIEECLIAEEKINEQLKKRRMENGERKTENGKRITDYELRTREEKGFTQVNPLQNANLKRLVQGWTSKLPHDNIVELFCGSGNFTEVLAPMAKKITAVDSDRNAIDLANLRLTHLPTYALTHFFCTDAVKFFSQKLDFPVDLLVLDPPRDGAAGVVEGVIKNRPKNILYISCNPATLARDLKFLKEFAGCELVQSQPIDMFPMSYHIESVNWITKQEPAVEDVQNACLS